jgi:probable HAF family extracellular repeat protein
VHDAQPRAGDEGEAAVKRRCLGRIGALPVLIACGLASVLAVVASAAPNHSQPRAYSITDLGTLGGSLLSRALEINDRGKIVGVSSVSGTADLHAFLYERGRMTDLFPGLPTSNASDINSRGKIVGTAGGRAFIYRRGQVTHIGVGAGFSSASGINHRGSVVGSFDLPGLPISHAFLYKHGQIIDLTPTLPSTGPLATFSTALDINDRGVVIGWSGSSHGVFAPRPFLWRRGTLADLPLTLPGDTFARPNRINDSGDVVGSSHPPQATQPSHAVLLRHDRLISLGPGAARSINNRGQVVGDGPGGAFLYQRGSRIELNSLLPASSGWTLSRAGDINDRGQIVGWGIHNDAQRAFLLSPSKEHDDDDDD